VKTIENIKKTTAPQILLRGRFLMLFLHLEQIHLKILELESELEIERIKIAKMSEPADKSISTDVTCVAPTILCDQPSKTLLSNNQTRGLQLTFPRGRQPSTLKVASEEMPHSVTSSVSKSLVMSSTSSLNAEPLSTQSTVGIQSAQGQQATYPHPVIDLT
jgi:hypothetical protein